MCLLQSLSTNLLSQEQEKKEIVTGGIQSMFTLYNLSSNDSLMKARQNPFGYTISGNLDIQVYRNFKIPLSFSLMNNQIYAFYPIPNLKFSQRLIHPSSVISFSPTFKWGTFYLGSHVPQVSKLLAGEVQIFGGGFDINPGIIRLAISHGISELAISPDANFNVRGSYKRDYQSLKIGIGKKDKSGFYINAVRFKDDINSIKVPTVLKPQEGLGVGADFQVKFSSKLKFNSDIGGTIYTDNQNSNIADSSDFTRLVSPLIKARRSSFIDYAAISSLTYNDAKFGLGLNAQYFGAGFKTPGFPNRPSDLIDITSNVRFSLFNNKLNINNTSGLRRDNLSNTKVSTNNSLLLNTSLNIQLFKFLGLNASYSNFGIERKEVFDSLNLSTISQNLAISPSINFKTNEVFHNINITYSKNGSENLNLISGTSNINRIESYNAMYNIKVGYFNLALNGFIAQNNQNDVLLSIMSANVLPNLTLLKKKLKIGLGTNYTLTKSGIRNDRRNSYFLKSSYDTGIGLNLMLNGRLNNIITETNGQTRGFSEQQLQFGLAYNFGFKKPSKSKTEDKNSKKVKEVIVNKDDKDKYTIPSNNNDKEKNETNNKEKKNENKIERKLINIEKIPYVTLKTLGYNSHKIEIRLKVLTSDKINSNEDNINNGLIVNTDTTKANQISKAHVSNEIDKPSEKKIIEPNHQKEDTINQEKDQICITNDINKSIGEPTKESDHPVNVSKEILNKYYIQIGAGKSKSDPKVIYKNLKGDIEVKYENGLYKYIIYGGETYEAAKTKFDSLKQNGLKDGFIAKYKNNQRVNLND